MFLLCTCILYFFFTFCAAFFGVIKNDDDDNLKTIQDRISDLFTNRKRHTGFQSVPKSASLNDLERRND